MNAPKGGDRPASPAAAAKLKQRQSAMTGARSGFVVSSEAKNRFILRRPLR